MYINLRKIVTSTFLAICSVAFIENANACMSAPDGFYITAEQTVEDAKAIYLVKLRNAQRIDPIPSKLRNNKNPIKDILKEVNENFERSILYSFDVLETYRGEHTPSLQIKVPYRRYPPENSNFLNHDRGSAFWKDPKVGRVSVAPDCSLSTSFGFRHDYLIVLPERWSAKSFEIIQNKEDDWWRYIIHKTENE